ncbi:hypothetical protein JN11_00736 [Mucilaginibacter frigoritolerans]|uniref:DUF7868 domain-containing protein n=1 Tax=Mucilaginibacter frigoritolerans TaxID=652788 RepID=A0A562UCC0_9SPHI|nr:hypothetical protein [Mucilaginibacter frigoritolerans]TWJ03199.1 hypothetical protein JN11_00736 [Mucilaginibacter frigoritolerans]
MSTYRISQLIASTDNFSWKGDVQTIVIDFVNHNDIDESLSQFRSTGFNSGHSLSLLFENMRGNDLVPVIDIYLNLDQEDKSEEKNYVGSMALYGLGESSANDGAGQDRVFDVGEVFSQLHNQPNWSDSQFKLTLIPSRSPNKDALLTIERIALYYYQL